MLWQPQLFVFVVPLIVTLHLLQPIFNFAVLFRRFCSVNSCAHTHTSCISFHLYLSPLSSLSSKLCQFLRPKFISLSYTLHLTFLHFLGSPPLHSAVLFMQFTSPDIKRIIMKKWRYTVCSGWHKGTVQLSERRQRAGNMLQSSAVASCLLSSCLLTDNRHPL